MSSGRRDSYSNRSSGSLDRSRSSNNSYGRRSFDDNNRDRNNSSFRRPDNNYRRYDNNKQQYNNRGDNQNRRPFGTGQGGGQSNYNNRNNNYNNNRNFRDNNRQDNRQRMTQRRDGKFDDRRPYQNQRFNNNQSQRGIQGQRRGNMRDRFGSQGTLNRRTNDNRRSDDHRRPDGNRMQYNNRGRGRFGHQNSRGRFQSQNFDQDRRTRLQRLARLKRRNDDDDSRDKTDEKTTELRKKLAEKHVNNRPRSDLLAKKIRMAKMRSALGARRKALTSKVKVVASKIIRKDAGDKKAADDDEELDDQEKEIDEEEKAAKEEKEEGASGPKVKDEALVEKKKAEKKEKEASKPKKISINLTCIHCQSKCTMVKEYIMHLNGRVHERAMNQLALRQKAQLSRLRLAQRNTQKEIDAKLLEKRSQYCSICQLNFKQSKADHEETEDHRSIKKFCIPYCNICKIGFNRPMLYESHRCSIQHLRRKAIMESTGKVSSDDERELDLSKYSTLDEVGPDDESDQDENKDDDKEGTEADDDQMDTGEKVNLGSEHITKVETLFCALCSNYISHRGDSEVNLSRHCVTRTHLKHYIRYKDDLALKAVDEAKQKRRLEMKKKQLEKLQKELEAEETNGKTAEAEAGSEAEDKAAEDKDDEEGNTERFDRFKTNAKEKVAAAENGEDEASSKMVVDSSEPAVVEAEA